MWMIDGGRRAEGIGSEGQVLLLAAVVSGGSPRSGATILNSSDSFISSIIIGIVLCCQAVWVTGRQLTSSSRSLLVHSFLFFAAQQSRLHLY